MLLYLSFILCDSQQSFLYAINQYRLQHSKDKFNTNCKLNNIAGDIVREMCTMRNKAQKFNIRCLLRKHKYFNFLNYDYSVNISHQNDYRSVLKYWKNNEDYNKKLLGDYDEIGLAFCMNAYGEGYWVVIFVEKDRLYYFDGCECKKE